jgi:hypothetical protein
MSIADPGTRATMPGDLQLKVGDVSSSLVANTTRPNPSPFVSNPSATSRDATGR